METNDLKNIWERQQKFLGRNFDLEKMKNLEYREECTKSMLLHLMGEVTEVLNEINYKTHKKRHPVDEEHLKEELIDVFKYYLNLCIIWGLDEKQFIVLYHRKSDVVDTRFEKEFKC
jgi:NTP pyrophosphatase (non-canonical NTP hydrolase)